MNKELKVESEPSTKPSRTLKRTHPYLNQTAREADIALVSAEGFLYNAERKDVIIGATRLYEINELINDHEHADDPQESPEIEQLLDERLPPSLQTHRDAFTKVTAAELHPHRRGPDHAVQLDRQNT